jgi:hypothetical protein
MVEQFGLARLHQERKNATDGSTVAPATVNRALKTLRLIFNYLELKSPTRKDMFFDEEGQTRVVNVQGEWAYFQETSQLLRDIATVQISTNKKPPQNSKRTMAMWFSNMRNRVQGHYKNRYSSGREDVKTESKSHLIRMNS